jgi:hypothetical protein
MTFRRIEQIDAETGEFMGTALALIPKKHYNAFVDGWVAMAQPALDLLAEYRHELGMEGYAVLLSLLGKLDFENHLVVNQVDLAKRLKMQRTNVNRAIKRLIGLGVLLEGPKAGPLRTYRLNPNFGWKGSAKNHLSVIKLDKKKKTAKAPATAPGTPENQE